MWLFIKFCFQFVCSKCLMRERVRLNTGTYQRIMRTLMPRRCQGHIATWHRSLVWAALCFTPFSFIRAAFKMRQLEQNRVLCTWAPQTSFCLLFLAAPPQVWSFVPLFMVTFTNLLLCSAVDWWCCGFFLCGTSVAVTAPTSAAPGPQWP